MSNKNNASSFHWLGSGVVTLIQLLAGPIFTTEAHTSVLPSSPLVCLQEEIPTSFLHSSPSADGTRIALITLGSSSETEPTESAALFLFDTTTNSFTRLVDLPSIYGRPPLLSADGTRVAFPARFDPLGTHPNGNTETFVFDIPTQTLIQLTSSPQQAAYTSPGSINADGSRIAVTSQADFVGNNQDHNTEIFLIDTHSDTISQITDTSSSTSSGGFIYHTTPLLNASGTRIAFGSNADFTGQNPDGNGEIFLFDVASKTFSQLTDTARTGEQPDSISADGTRIVTWTTQNFTGENADGNFEIFLFDTRTNTVKQISDTQDVLNISPVISLDGQRVAFTTEYDSFSLSHVFLYDAETDSLTQVSQTRQGINELPTLNADGSRLVYRFISKRIAVALGSSADSAIINTNTTTAATLLASCVPAGAQTPAIQATIESPQNGPVSGVSGIHGWTFSTQPDVQIGAIHLLIDGVRYGEIPCCSERADVQAAFSEFAPEMTLHSAWSIPFNWSLLSPGPHTIQIEIRSTDGQLLFVDERSVTVIKPPGTEFLDQFDLSTASVSIEDNAIILSEVVIRDQASQQIQNIHARFEWFTESQSLRMVEAQAIKASTAVYAPEQHGEDLPLLSDAQALSGLHLFIDHPGAGQTVAGTAVLNGWALAANASQSIADIRLVLDGQLAGSIPCCFERADVAAAFPDNPNALSSGWGLTFNYGLLTSGPHTIGVQVTDSAGATVRALRRAIHVVRPGEFELIDQFDLSEASARIEQQNVILEDVLVRDKTTQQEAQLTLRFRWSVGSQTLGLVAAQD